MRRRTATLLATGTFLSLAGYAAWCGRSFYLKPRALDTRALPVEIAETAPGMAAAMGMIEPEEFRLGVFLRYLREPHETPSVKITSTVVWDGHLMAVHRTTSLRPRVLYILESEKWRHVTELEAERYLEDRESEWNSQREVDSAEAGGVPLPGTLTPGHR